MLLSKEFLGLLLLSTTFYVVRGHDDHEKDEKEEDNGVNCCSNLFVASKGILADTQGSLLGKYVLDGVDQRKNLIYKKLVNGEPYYLYYRVNGQYEHGTNGWTIGILDGNSFNIVTRNSAPVCPEGINGAYDRDITLDTTFNIACHSEKVKVDCCPKVKVSSSSIISKVQGAHLGEYVMKGKHNGYPMYYKQYRDIESFLFYRKTGLPMDGWMINSDGPRSQHFSITTHSETYCPNEIKTGYNLDKDEDATFKIVCSAKIPLEKDDELINKTTPQESNEEEEEKKPEEEKEPEEEIKKDMTKQPRNPKTLPNDFDYPSLIQSGASSSYSCIVLLLASCLTIKYLQ
uniref:Uncharacterized protein n=1 Tax=Lepeophtheirus salmonis TaxID=72036 RepID=A0A0K2UA06_LEPSM